MSTFPAPSIIPQPLQLQPQDGYFRLDQNTHLLAEDTSAHIAIETFGESFYRLSGLRLDAAQKPASQNTIVLRHNADLSPESYTLEISPTTITISAAEHKGFFYALQTLLQCVPFDQPIEAGVWNLPCLSVHDKPRFGWRGLMLDSSRHFQPVAFIKKFIDVMALHKFNVLHWHLVDDQGWRIEIEKYPALTSISAWRKTTRVGHERKGTKTDFDGRPHGGFYSKAELQELVTYAGARGITIMPEIEMPGHAMAALAAFPELACTEGPFEVWPHWGINKEVFCAGNDQVIRFFENVLEEVLEIFPSPFIHVGGDECLKDRWKECPRCQQRIQDEGLKDEHELQSWFIRHFDQFLNERGRRLIGWDEILEGGLAQNAAVMSWRGEEGGIAAAQAGHHVVMAPHQSTYLDYYQSEDQEKEPLAIGGFTPLSKIYAYEPIPAALNETEAALVLGGQSQLWTEYMPHGDHVEYMAYPRACALAEALWSPPEARSYDSFKERLHSHLHLLDRLNVNYRRLDDPANS